MRAKHFCCFHNSRIKCEDFVSKIYLPPPPLASAAVRSKAVILLLLIHCLLLLPLHTKKHTTKQETNTWVCGFCVGLLLFDMFLGVLAKKMIADCFT